MNSMDPAGETAPRADSAQPDTRRPPLIAILLCSAFILVVAFRSPIEGISDRFDERLIFALAMVVPSLLIAWIVAFAISFRKARRGWKFGSLAVLGAVAIAIALLRAALPAAGLSPDAGDRQSGVLDSDGAAATQG